MENTEIAAAFIKRLEDRRERYQNLTSQLTELINENYKDYEETGSKLLERYREFDDKKVVVTWNSGKQILGYWQGRLLTFGRDLGNSFCHYPDILRSLKNGGKSVRSFCNYEIDTLDNIKTVEICPSRRLED